MKKLLLIAVLFTVFQPLLSAQLAGDQQINTHERLRSSQEKQENTNHWGSFSILALVAGACVITGLVGGSLIAHKIASGLKILGTCTDHSCDVKITYN